MNLRTFPTHVVNLGTVILRDPTQVRHIRRFTRTFGRHPLDARVPWLAFDVADWMNENLDRNTNVFEYGGGGSTAWFADHVARVVTAESDTKWADHLRSAVGDEKNVEILQAGSQDSFRNYISLIDSYGDASFDFVAVDGRERVRCVAAAMKKVRPGGHILLDDSERAKYDGARMLLADWPSQEFQGICPWKSTAGHTTVWTKPQIRSDPTK